MAIVKIYSIAVETEHGRRAVSCGPSGKAIEIDVDTERHVFDNLAATLWAVIAEVARNPPPARPPSASSRVEATPGNPQGLPVRALYLSHVDTCTLCRARKSCELGSRLKLLEQMEAMSHGG